MIKKIGFDEIREYSEIRINVSAKGVDEYIKPLSEYVE